jgi:hypothetical protein
LRADPTERGALDVVVTLLAHVTLVLAVALLCALTGLYVQRAPLLLPWLAAVLSATGVRLLGISSSPAAVWRVFVVVTLALILGQVLFWSARLSAHLGGPVIEGAQRLDFEFLWVLSTLDTTAADGWRLVSALPLAALLVAFPWRRVRANR